MFAQMAYWKTITGAILLLPRSRSIADARGSSGSRVQQNRNQRGCLMAKDARKLGHWTAVAAVILTVSGVTACGSKSSVAVQPTPGPQTVTPSPQNTKAGQTPTPTHHGSESSTPTARAAATKTPARTSRTPGQGTRTPTPSINLDCCQQHPAGGCDSRPCQSCVCTVHPVCCSGDVWDATCVDSAINDCSQLCLCQ